MAFQRQVNALPIPGIVGEQASINPYSSVIAGPGGLTAGVSALVGNFHWVTATNTVESNCPTTQLTVPTGFLGHNFQALITVWLGVATLQVPKGIPVTLFDAGDFFALNQYAPATYGQKAFVNKFGQMVAAAAGSFVTTDVSSAGTITSAHIDNGVTIGVAGNVLTVVTGSGLEVGQNIIDPATSLVIGTITSLGTGTGGAGTYNLNQNANYPAVSTFTVANFTATGASGATASFATNVMTVTIAPTAGSFAVGQFIQAAGVAAGTYITSLGTGTGGTGTYNLSTTPGTIAAEAAAGSGWIETPWSVKLTVNAGDITVVGILN